MLEFNTKEGDDATLKGIKLEEIKKMQNSDMRTWSKEEAVDWLESHDFKANDYSEMTNWHSYRQNEPKGDIRTDSSPLNLSKDDGVHILYQGKETEVQSIRFYHGGN